MKSVQFALDCFSSIPIDEFYIFKIYAAGMKMLKFLKLLRLLRLGRILNKFQKNENF